MITSLPLPFDPNLIKTDPELHQVFASEVGMMLNELVTQKQPGLARNMLRFCPLGQGEKIEPHAIWADEEGPTEQKVPVFPQWSSDANITQDSIDMQVSNAYYEIVAREDTLFRNLVQRARSYVEENKDLHVLLDLMAMRMKDLGMTPARVVLNRSQVGSIYTQMASFEIDPITNQDRMMRGQFGTFVEDHRSLANVEIWASPGSGVEEVIPQNEVWMFAEPSELGTFAERVSLFGESFTQTNGLWAYSHGVCAVEVIYLGIKDCRGIMRGRLT